MTGIYTDIETGDVIDIVSGTDEYGAHYKYLSKDAEWLYIFPDVLSEAIASGRLVEGRQEVIEAL